MGNIIPIYKNKGNKNDPESFRPITLLSCIGKLFTSILFKRLSNFVEQYEILCENQTGFRKHYSTIDNMFVLYSLFDILRMKKKKLYCAFIDFKAAFDKVWRVGLWKKTVKNNISGKCFKIIFYV